MIRTLPLSYRLHVEGQPEGETDTDIQHTYRLDSPPKTMDEARKIAEDFQKITKMRVEEVTTVVKTRLIHLGN